MTSFLRGDLSYFRMFLYLMAFYYPFIVVFKCYKFKIERLIFKNDLFIIKKPQINEAFFDSQLNLINPVISSI